MIRLSFLRKSTVWIFTSLFIFAATALMVISPASGRSFRIAKTPDKGGHFGCATCHVSARGGGSRNAFGKDYEKVALPAGDVYTQELGALDSDGDGASNDAEFAAGTHPGDPGSKPE